MATIVITEYATIITVLATYFINLFWTDFINWGVYAAIIEFKWNITQWKFVGIAGLKPISNNSTVTAEYISFSESLVFTALYF